FSIHRIQSLHVEREVRAHAHGAREVFEQSLARDAKMMNGMILFLKNDKELREAWRTRDRDALQHRTAWIFEKILAGRMVTRFSLIDLNNVCFLRAHNPSRRGDEITRSTLTRAVRTSRPARGVEPHPSGVLSLRVVHPWRIDEKLAGYIELGGKVDHIASTMEMIADADVVFTVEKKYLDRTQWEESP
ncbi:MAG: hypothetical protein GY859_18625, partial [Desulfobacterales bacterium]|nr:hypothetical protein [Desulfobacterales bacterium]